jgi:hypothetical protein
MFSFSFRDKWGCGRMITFTETETEAGGWGIIAVPQDKADGDFLNDNSPQGALAYVDLVLSHALECVEDAQQPRIRARLIEAIGELELAKHAIRTTKEHVEPPCQEPLLMVIPAVLPKLNVIAGGKLAPTS